MVEPNDLYRASKTQPGFIDRGDRVRIEIAGADRAKFLHNLTTNDVKRLAVGRGHESFVTSLQGKTLGYVTLVASEDRILLRTDPGGAGLLLPHLRKYGVFDEVSIDDQSALTFEFHLSGPSAADLVRLAGGELPPEGDLSHCSTELVGSPVRLIRESPTGQPGLTLIGGSADGSRIAGQLHELGVQLGLVDLTPALFDLLRIEAGTPVFGREVTSENLPQEIGRDNRAISFVKGCYLGQETVARIDALGHVNKVLKGFKFLTPDDVPTENLVLTREGKTFGKLTSTAFSPGWGRPIALGFVRAAQLRWAPSFSASVKEEQEKGSLGASSFATCRCCPPAQARPEFQGVEAGVSGWPSFGDPGHHLRPGIDWEFKRARSRYGASAPGPFEFVDPFEFAHQKMALETIDPGRWGVNAYCDAGDDAPGCGVLSAGSAREALWHEVASGARTTPLEAGNENRRVEVYCCLMILKQIIFYAIVCNLVCIVMIEAAKR
ncbi:glycine cleavage T C-terminal barrel domain-containing protein [Singulisphaera sp. Ch08]|uniref:Glycine cleavage T C-terminal barrel domain-containing protein n=1 Tax=Singulisphaera sp. Ch08 TaxID=3120278 RepID=A0AAU7CPE5_9BACT